MRKALRELLIQSCDRAAVGASKSLADMTNIACPHPPPTLGSVKRASSLRVARFMWLERERERESFRERELPIT